ncbi:MAG: hypothetical protein WC623_21815 [Pedobacter sp.]|uniref:hypothetical protein n=1 Tax=Pedobacter sp. TaxID=1411316 RepID=UPI0035617196
MDAVLQRKEENKMANKLLNFFTGGLAQANEDYYMVCKLADDISFYRRELIYLLEIGYENRTKEQNERMEELEKIIEPKEIIYDKYIKEHPAQI